MIFDIKNSEILDRSNVNIVSQPLHAIGSLMINSGKINSGIIQAQGDVTVNCTGGAGTSDCTQGGGAQLHLVGGANQTITVDPNADLIDGDFYFDKPSGTVTLASDLNLTAPSQSLYLVDNTNPDSMIFDLSSHDLTVSDTLEIGTENILNLNAGSHSESVLVNNGTINP